MEFLPLNELQKRRKKLAKLLMPLPITDCWDEEDERSSKELIRRELAEIDAQIAERTGKSSGASEKAG